MADDTLCSREQAELNKFLLTDDKGDQKVTVRTQATGSIIFGVKYCSFDVQYPSGTQEIYRFYSDENQTTLLTTVTINYTDLTKEFISNGNRVDV